MNIWIIVLLGAIQGLTEFLPISSSGHLVLLEKIFGIQDNLILLNIFLHLGSLVAVIVYYRKSLWQQLQHPWCEKNFLLVTATIPTIIIVLIFEPFIESSFGGQYLIIGFLITAFLLVLASFEYRQKKVFGYKTSIIMGITQGIATLPGISRSGSTLCAGLFCGQDREEAANFSFLMSIPIILASLVYELTKLDSIVSISYPWWIILVGMLMSFVFGYLAIRWMIHIVKKARLYYFSIYLVILSILMFAFGLY